MNFTRKRIRGQAAKVRRTWLSENGYRIIWRSEAFGIQMPPRFQATVRVTLPQGGEMWDFVSTRRLFKTLKAAREACEKHQWLWSRATKATGARGLQELFGRIPSGFPTWVRPKLSQKIHRLLTDVGTGSSHCEQ